MFAACKVRRIPTTVVFFNGQIQDQIFGALKGGTKTDVVASSCVGLTTVENISQMLERFAV